MKKAEPRNAREKKENGMERGVVLGNQMVYSQPGEREGCGTLFNLALCIVWMRFDVACIF